MGVAAAAAVIVAVGATIAATSGHGGMNLVDTAHAAATKPSKPAPAIHVVSVTPAGGSANGSSPVTVTFSAKLAANSPMPTLSPRISGTWQVEENKAVFSPAVGFTESTHVTVKIPGGSNGVQSAEGAKRSGGNLASAKTATFITGSYSTTRLQQLLAQLGYLPLSWTPSSGTPVPSGNANAQLAAAYNAPSGGFSFHSGYPSELRDQWSAGTNNNLVAGAVRAFEYNQNLTMDGIAGPDVWRHLLTAVARNESNPSGYTYAWADQNSPESLRVWHNGRLILDTPANTGIPQSPTQDGTFPVYLKFQVTQMKGNNPNGTPYDDTVYWVSYFNGGDAVHYYPRPGYGYYQSLGCVEIQWDPAKYIWHYLTYGTLVTVSGPVA